MDDKRIYNCYIHGYLSSASECCEFFNINKRIIIRRTLKRGVEIEFLEIVQNSQPNNFT